MSSLRSYLPIACAVTRLSIAASSSRRERPEAARAILSRCPIMVISPSAAVYKITKLCHYCNLRKLTARSDSPQSRGLAGLEITLTRRPRGPARGIFSMTQALATTPGTLTTRSRSHRRLAAFVDWIKAERDTREAIHKQAADIRRIITGQATADGLVVTATPEAGSFAKHTGLRRHMRGNSEIEGQDVDLPFVVKPTAKDGDRIGELLRRFDTYAGNSYPNTPSEVTASSV